MDAREGSTLAGRYRLISKLGGGGAAAVWRAEDAETSSVVAVKLLHPKHRAHVTIRDRLAREADLLSRFQHPNVARALGFGFEHAQPYIAMELIEGGSLQDELAERSLEDRHFEPDELGRLVHELASAVAYAHGQGVVHRDLKPANIMLASGPEGPTVKVLDFGIAKLLENTDPQIMTTRGRVLGSSFYMAPEQALGQPVTARCDIFAFTSVVLEALTLRRAWVRNHKGGFVLAFGEPARMNKHNEASELLRRLAQRPRPKPSEMRPGLPERFDEVLAHGLAAEPADRAGSALEIAEELISRLPATWGGDDTAPTPLAAALGSRAAPTEEVSLIGAVTTPDVAPDEDATVAREVSGPGEVSSGSLAALLDNDAQVEPQPLDRNHSPSVVVTTAESHTMVQDPPTVARPGPGETMAEDAWARTPTGASVASMPAPSRFGTGARIVVGAALVLVLLVGAFFAGRLSTPPAQPVTQVSFQPSKPAPAPAATAAPRPDVKVAEAAATPPAAPPPSAPTPATPKRAARAPASAPPPPPPAAAPKPTANLAPLQSKLRALRANPTDLEGVEALAAAIRKEANKIEDPDLRRRVRRIAGSSGMVGDLDGVARALGLLESGLK